MNCANIWAQPCPQKIPRRYHKDSIKFSTNRHSHGWGWRQKNAYRYVCNVCSRIRRGLNRSLKGPLKSWLGGGGGNWWIGQWIEHCIVLAGLVNIRRKHQVLREKWRFSRKPSLLGGENHFSDLEHEALTGLFHQDCWFKSFQNIFWQRIQQISWLDLEFKLVEGEVQAGSVDPSRCVVLCWLISNLPTLISPNDTLVTGMGWISWSVPVSCLRVFRGKRFIARPALQGWSLYQSMPWSVVIITHHHHPLDIVSYYMH